MEIFLIVMVLFILGAMKASHENNKPETLLDCSDNLCKWNDGKPCPYKLIQYKGQHGLRRRVEGIHECCSTRQAKVKMAKLVLEGKINTKGQSIIDSSRKTVEWHKREYPEEHEFLFGEK